MTAVGIAVAIAAFQQSIVPRAFAAGVVLYLAYVISIGGDFMSGRFRALPLFAACC